MVLLVLLLLLRIFLLHLRLLLLGRDYRHHVVVSELYADFFIFISLGEMDDSERFITKMTLNGIYLLCLPITNVFSSREMSGRELVSSIKMRHEENNKKAVEILRLSAK